MLSRKKHKARRRCDTIPIRHSRPHVSGEKRVAFQMSRVRWLVAIISGLLVSANAGVQLWQNLDLGSHLPWDTKKPPAVEQVEPKANVEID